MQKKRFVVGKSNEVLASKIVTLEDKIEELQTKLNNVYMLSEGIQIEANTNLNNITEIGNYYCAFTNTVSTLSNCPTTFAFTMKVEMGTGTGYLCQTIREYYYGSIWYRNFNGVSGSWERWYKIADPLMHDYSYTEVPIGTYFGKVLYGRYFDFGTLPGNESKTVFIPNSSNIAHMHINLGKTIWTKNTYNYTSKNVVYNMVHQYIVHLCTGDNDNGLFSIQIKTSNTDAANYKALIYLEYTKV